MSLDSATADRYSHYSTFPRPADFRLEPSSDIIYLDPPKSFSFKGNPEYSQFTRYIGPRQSSIDTMASAQSDDMETFQRLSDQYESEVAVSSSSTVRSTEPILIALGSIGWGNATNSGTNQRVCQRGSDLPDKDGCRCYRFLNTLWNHTWSDHVLGLVGNIFPVQAHQGGRPMWLARYGSLKLDVIMELTIGVAATFGYFEQLLHQDDPAKIIQEIDRFRTFNTSAHAVGFESDIVDMFMEPALELLEKIHEALLRKERADIMLLRTMISEESDSILYYFKVKCPRELKKSFIFKRLNSPDLFRSLQAPTCNSTQISTSLFWTRRYMTTARHESSRTNRRSTKLACKPSRTASSPRPQSR